MASLTFSLLPEPLLQLHNALTCLSKFSDTVAIEAEYDLLRLSALNSTKSSYAAFAFDADKFFEIYTFGVNRDSSNASRNFRSNKFCCQILLRALLSVFKARPSVRDKDTAVERCEVELHEDMDEAECRFAVRMICGLGVIKTYKLTYEPTTIQHAIFDRTRTTNQWSIEPRILKEITDHFSLSAEQLDIYSIGEKAIFTSFTTKITDGKEVLKQPVHTSVAIEKRDFAEFAVEDNLHVAISLKDFKAVIAHAESASAMITARYTVPCRPMQIAYELEGMNIEFTMMTTGASGGDDAPTSRPAVPQLSARQTPAAVTQNTAPVTQNTPTSDTRQMPPPPRSSRPVRPLTGTATPSRSTPAETNPPSQRPPASINFDSLFVPADDDRQWDVPNEEEEAEDMLGWDATADQETFNASLGPRLRDTEPGLSHSEERTAGREEEMGIPPTQRMSQLHGLGLFD